MPARPMAPARDGARLAMLAAGGTGGHVFPAEALARELSARGWRVVLVTDTRGRAFAGAFADTDMVPLRLDPSSRRNAVASARFAWQLTRATETVWRFQHRWRPTLVAGFGGYAAAPALAAAALRGIPIILHEQNAVLGKVNRLFAGRASALACGFEQLDLAPANVRDHVHVTGNPVRPDIAALYRRPYPAIGSRLRILVTGGSQGAAVFATVVPEALALLPQAIRARLAFHLQARPDQVTPLRERLDRLGVRAEIAPFFDDIATVLGRSHLVVARAGASSISEIALCGRPSVLVPLPNSADDHQSANAEILAGTGGAEILRDGPGIEIRLAQCLRALIARPGRLATMARAALTGARPNAAGILADLAESVAADVAVTEEVSA